MKKNKIVFAALSIILLNYPLSSCKKDAAQKKLPSVTTSDQASTVSFAICSTIGDFLLTSRLDDKTWTNETKSGYASGTIKISGSYTHTETDFTYYYPVETYEFDNITVVCDNLNDDTNDIYPSLTGNASVSGTVIEHHGSGGSTFSGNWTMTGHMKLSKIYDDDVSFTFYFYEDYFTSNFSGTLTVKSGTTYQIQSEFK